jgi:hypothetical protein
VGFSWAGPARCDMCHTAPGRPGIPRPGITPGAPGLTAQFITNFTGRGIRWGGDPRRIAAPISVLAWCSQGRLHVPGRSGRGPLACLLAVSVRPGVAFASLSGERLRQRSAAEGEAVDRLGGHLTFFLRPAGEFGEAGSAAQLAGQHPPGGQRADDPRDVDRGMPVVVELCK